jgi:hypothetical protein
VTIDGVETTVAAIAGRPQAARAPTTVVADGRRAAIGPAGTIATVSGVRAPVEVEATAISGAATTEIVIGVRAAAVGAPAAAGVVGKTGETGGEVRLVPAIVTVDATTGHRGVMTDR